MPKKISPELEKKIQDDLERGMFVRRFLSLRSCENIGNEYGYSHITIRRVFRGIPTMIPDQELIQIQMLGKQKEWFEPLRNIYSVKNIAARYGVTHTCVERVRRDYLKPNRRKNHVY